MDLVRELIDRDRKSRKRIAIIGDALNDVWIHGRLESCQDHCPKFVQESIQSTSGGAANAHNQLSHWNCEAHGLWALERETKTRYVVNGHIVFRHDTMAFRRRINLKDVEGLWALGIDAVLISDYDKGFLNPSDLSCIIDTCKRDGIPCVADAKRQPSFYRGAFLKCNAEYMTRQHLGYDHDPGSVVTAGAVPVGFGSRMFPYAECKNHVGAGDCFAALLTLSLAHGMSLVEATQIAYCAGRVYVQHTHNRAPWPHEIRKELDPVGGKILACSDLPALRQSTDRIIFTNGCFDLLHAGHIHCLREAKKMGDCLVVGVNDDESVKRLKGPKRPAMPLEQRIAMLCALEMVDYVVPFSGDSPSQELIHLRPDILAKGDFPDRRTDGDELVRSVKLISPLPGFSTSSTLERLRTF